MEHGKVFNRTYPGPWIGISNDSRLSYMWLIIITEACWGDWIGENAVVDA